jgi:protein phosphatase
VRNNNEDNFHVVRFGRYLQTVFSSLAVDQFSEEADRHGYGFVVADGLGGHAAGEVASRRAIALLLEYALQTPDWLLGREDALLARVMARASERFQSVNAAVIAEAQRQQMLGGMGTTLSVTMSLGDNLIVSHIGDSRVYLLRNGTLHRLTTDHTIAEERAGIDPAAARFRNVLTRAIGINPLSGEPDVLRYRLADGDRLLLCTDGLTDMVAEEAIGRELARAAPSDETCQALINLALDGGGRDNVTVVVATYRFPNPPAPAPAAS